MSSFFFFTMQIENLLNQNDNTFISEHINQTTKNIIELHNIQVNSKRKKVQGLHEIILIYLVYLRLKI